MKNSFPKKPLFVLSVCALSLYAVGYGYWTIYNETASTENDLEIPNTTEKKVCFIVNSLGTSYYTSLDKALSVAYDNSVIDTIYVLPGTTPSIDSTATIESGDSLRLILSEENKDEDTSDVEDNGFADADPNKYRISQVTLSATLTIESGASLVIAGQTGGASPQGATAGKYCELVIGEGATINCSGTINCYGYIKDNNETLENIETESITISEGGKVYEPLTIYDWSSSSTAKGRNDDGSFPFNLYDLSNIRPKMKFNYGSYLYCYGHVYGTTIKHKHATEPVEIIGLENDAAFIQLKTGGSVFWNFDSESKDKTDDKSKHKSYVDIEGNFNLGHIKVNMYIDFDSKDFYLPVSYLYKLTHKNGTGNIDYKTKFLPGSSLEMASDSVVNVNDPLIFYESNKTSSGTVIYMHDNYSKPSSLINNGKLIINSAFGGEIKTSSDTGVIEVGNDYFIPPESREYNAKANPNYIVMPSFGGNLQYAKSTAVSSIKANIVAGTTYRSLGSVWTSDTVNYGILLGPSSGKSIAATARDYIVTAYVSGSDGSKATVTDVNWKISDTGITLESEKDENGNPVAKFHIDANSSKKDVSYTLTFKCKINGEEKTLQGTYVATHSNSCLLPGSRVAMADGTYKDVQFIKPGDAVLSFNHESGKLEPNQIIINEHSNECAKYHFVMKIVFDDGKYVEIAERHGFFDAKENKYVFMTLNNYHNFIGHSFVSFENGVKKLKRIKNIECSNVYTKVYAPVTKRHFNLICDDMLNVPAAIPGLLNIFEYDPQTLQYNPIKMANDIEKYGLLTYEDFKDKIAYDVYKMIPGEYLSVSIGKGLLTWDEFDQYIKLWANKLLSNRPQ